MKNWITIVKSLFERDALFEMANLSPAQTGLPFVIYVSQKGGARHDVRVKVGGTSKAKPHEMISVAVRPFPHVIRATLPAAERELIFAWIVLNEDVLVAYWYGDIPYTQDMMAALKSV